LEVPDNFLDKVNNILWSSERDFANQVKIYTPEQITNLLKAKRELKILEQHLSMIRNLNKHQKSN
jgi:hypothetical protein